MGRTKVRPVGLTVRDRAIVQAVWSLGSVTADGLRRLFSQDTSANTFTARLRRLVSARYLARTEVVCGLRHTYLYGAGRRSRGPGAPAPWRPSLTQLEHTLTVERTLLRLLQPAFTPPLTRTGWQGEAEIRAWAAPGEPYPDLTVHWSAPTGQGEQRHGTWAVEVDLATEAQAAWRRKLLRYLVHSPGHQLLLVVTTSHRRAANLADLAARDGTPAVTTTFADLAGDADPVVFDATIQRRRPLSIASQDYVDDGPVAHERRSRVLPGGLRSPAAQWSEAGPGSQGR